MSAHSPTSSTVQVPTDHQTPPDADIALSRRPSVFTRLKKFSRASVDHHPTPVSRTPTTPTSRARHSSQPKLKAELATLCLDFPQPPTHIPTPIASAHTSKRHSGPPFLESTPIDEASSTFFTRDPFRSEFGVGAEAVPPQVKDQFPPVDRAPSPAPSFKSGGRTRSLKRIKAFTKEALRASIRTPVSEVSSNHSIKAKGARSLRGVSAPAPAPEPHTEDIPEPAPALILDTAELTSSPEATSFPSRLLLQSSSEETLPAPPQESSLDLIRQLSIPTNQRGPFAPAFLIPPPTVRYEFVNPADLTASPFSFSSGSLLNSTRTSFIPPSPSWLSRNVQPDEPFDFRSVLPSPASQGRTPYLFDLERLIPSPIESEFEYDYHPSELFRPDSPPPLPIPAPVIVAVPPPHHLRPQPPYIVIEDCPDSDPESDSVSVNSIDESTLTTESCPVSLHTSSSRTVPISARASVSSPTLSLFFCSSPSSKHASYTRGRRSTIDSIKRSRSVPRRSYRSSFDKESRFLSQKVCGPFCGQAPCMLTATTPEHSWSYCELSGAFQPLCPRLLLFHHSGL